MSKGIIFSVLILISISLAYAIVDTQVIEDIEENGYADVIIKLKDSSVSTISSSSSNQDKLEAKKEMITTSQDEFLSKFNLGKISSNGFSTQSNVDFELVHRYKTFNSIYGKVSAFGIEKIIEDSRVESIYTNSKVFASEATPL